MKGYKRDKKLFNRKGAYRFFYNPLRRRIIRDLEYILKNYAMSESLQDEIESTLCCYEFREDEE
jgi:hypothetical protein